MGKHRHKRGTVGAARPRPTPTLPPPVPFWRVVALPTLAAAALVASVWFYLKTPEQPNRVVLTGRPTSGPITDEFRLVDAFRTSRNADAKSTLNLAPEPVFDDKPVGEEEGEAMHATYILHRVREVVDISAGEPVKGGGWLDTPRRYTLATRGQYNAPKVAVEIAGRVQSPASLFIIDPDIVVEVRDGKIHALRTEMPWK
jgi:hypothetical protein